MEMFERKPPESVEGSKDDEDPKTEGIEMNHLENSQNFKMTDGISNCLVECPPSGFIVDGVLVLEVPMAQGESDLAEDDEDEDDADDSNDSSDSTDLLDKDNTVSR